MRVSLRIPQTAALMPALFPLLMLLAGCQDVVEPPDTTMRKVTVVAETNTAQGIEGLEATFFHDSANASEAGHAVTGRDGRVVIELPIPNFGKTFSLRLRKGTEYQRALYPVFLKCQDTTLVIVLPRYAGGPDTTVVQRVVCSGPAETLPLRFIACPTETVEQAVDLVSGCATAVDFTIPTGSAAPFGLRALRNGVPASGTVTLAPGETIRFVASYSGLDQLTPASATIALRNSVGGGVDLKLYGEPNKDCAHPPIEISCDNPVDVSASCPIGRVCVGRQMGSMSMTVHNGGAEPMEITVPEIPPPFIGVIRDAGGAVIAKRTIVLAPGESFAITISIKAERVGTYPFRLVLSARCLSSGSRTEIAEAFDAQADSCNNCDCPTGGRLVNFRETVPVGEERTVQEVVFRNDRDCPILVKSVGAPSSSEWSVVPPTNLPQTVQPGQELKLTLKFKPKSSGASNATLPFVMYYDTLRGACSYNVLLAANGCATPCPEIVPPAAYRHPTPNSFDTLYLEETSSRRVFVSVAGRQNRSKTECFSITNPDTACKSITLQITPPAPPFRLTEPSSTTVTIDPGETLRMCLEFVAPTIEEARARVRANLGLIYRDSIRVRAIGGGNCASLYPMQAEVDTLPRCGERQSLAQYEQYTTEAPASAYEVYNFGDARKYTDQRTSAAYSGQLPGSQYPLVHDLYIDDTTAGAPAMKIVNAAGGRGLAVVRVNARLSDFCDNIDALLKSTRPLLPNYTYEPGIPARIGDILAARLGPNSYALILISGIDLGSGNIARRTIVDFYVIHPVLP